MQACEQIGLREIVPRTIAADYVACMVYPAREQEFIGSSAMKTKRCAENFARGVTDFERLWLTGFLLNDHRLVANLPTCGDVTDPELH